MTATYFYDLFHFNRFLICSTTSKQEIVFTLVVWLSLFNSALCQVCGVFSFLFVFSFFMKLPCWAFCQSSHNAILILLWNGSTFKLHIDKVNVLKNATAKDLHEHRDRGKLDEEYLASWPFFQVHPNAVSFHVVQFDPSPKLFLLTLPLTSVIKQSLN